MIVKSYDIYPHPPPRPRSSLHTHALHTYHSHTKYASLEGDALTYDLMVTNRATVRSSSTFGHALVRSGLLKYKPAPTKDRNRRQGQGRAADT